VLADSRVLPEPRCHITPTRRARTRSSHQTPAATPAKPNPARHSPSPITKIAQEPETPDPVRPGAVNSRFQDVRLATGGRPAGIGPTPSGDGRLWTRNHGGTPCCTHASGAGETPAPLDGLRPDDGLAGRDLDVDGGADLGVQPDPHLVRPHGLDRVADLDPAPVELGAAGLAHGRGDVRRADRAEQAA